MLVHPQRVCPSGCLGIRCQRSLVQSGELTDECVLPRAAV